MRKLSKGLIARGMKYLQTHDVVGFDRSFAPQEDDVVQLLEGVKLGRNPDRDFNFESLGHPAAKLPERKAEFIGMIERFANANVSTGQQRWDWIELAGYYIDSIEENNGGEKAWDLFPDFRSAWQDFCAFLHNDSEYDGVLDRIEWEDRNNLIPKVWGAALEEQSED